LPKWNFDGGSTGQAPGDDSEVVLRPCRMFKDPFHPRQDNLQNILVMCDCYIPNGEPIETNSRAIARKRLQEEMVKKFGLVSNNSLLYSIWMNALL
jgi:glutamine synthetase